MSKFLLNFIMVCFTKICRENLNLEKPEQKVRVSLHEDPPPPTFTITYVTVATMVAFNSYL
jgi:hypothetical protein